MDFYTQLKRSRKFTLEHLQTMNLKSWMNFTHNNVGAVLYKFRNMLDFCLTMSSLDIESEELMTHDSEYIAQHLYTNLVKVMQTEAKYNETNEKIAEDIWDRSFMHPDFDTQVEHFGYIHQHMRFLENQQKRAIELEQLKDQHFTTLIEQLVDTWPLLYIYKVAVGCFNPYYPTTLHQDIQGYFEANEPEDKDNEMSVLSMVQEHLRFELLTEVLIFLRKCRFITFDQYMYQNKRNNRLQRKMYRDKVDWMLEAMNTLHDMLPSVLVTYHVFSFMNENIVHT